MSTYAYACALVKTRLEAYAEKCPLFLLTGVRYSLWKKKYLSLLIGHKSVCNACVLVSCLCPYSASHIEQEGEKIKEKCVGESPCRRCRLCRIAASCKFYESYNIFRGCMARPKSTDEK